MTEYQVKLSQTAWNDIFEIVRYIQMELKAPQTAGRLYGLLKQEISSLSQFPERNSIMDLPDIRELKLRRLLVKNYSVFYTVDSDELVVQVARVIYSGRNISRQLTDTEWDVL